MEAILIRDMEALRSRLLGKGEPARIYAQVREVVRHPEMGYPLWRFLCRMVEPDSVPKGEMLREVEALASRGSWHQAYMLDVHTWIASSAMARLAIYMDWAMEQGEMPPRRQARLAGDLLDVMEKSILPVLRARVPENLAPGQAVPLPNQGVALLLASAALGAVFGHRRGRNPRARRLLRETQDRLDVLLAHLWPDGYDGEGPTYQLAVQGPALALICEMLEEITGRDLFDQPHGPSGFTLRRWYETTCFALLSGTGVSRPFDDYGYGRPTAILSFAYAAGRSGNPAFLQPVRKGGLWHAHQCLWDQDDRTLSLLFWPDDPSPGTPPDTRLLRSTLASLTTERHPQTELLVLWKTCEPLPHTHAHTDPGSVTLSCSGVPLVIDGRPFIMSGAPLQDAPYHRLFAGTNTDYFMPYRFGKSDVRDQGAVALAPHNTIVIDGVDDLPLTKPVGGRLVAWEETDDLTRLVVDVAEPYRCKFDLHSFLREVTAYRDGPCVVRDELRSASVHDFTWRMHVRPEVEACAGGVDVSTREGLRLAIRTPAAEPFEMKYIEAYPGVFEGHSIRLQMHHRGRDARFIVALRGSDIREELADITGGWRFRSDPRLEGLASGWRSGKFEPQGTVSMSLPPSLSGYPKAVGFYVWYARRLPRLTCPPSTPVILEMGSPLVPIRLWVAGRPVPVKHGCWESLLPVQIELGLAAEVSGRTLVLFMADFPGIRPPAPLRLIRFTGASAEPLRLVRRPRGVLVLHEGQRKRELAPDIQI